jgi:hypothetical protein
MVGIVVGFDTVGANVGETEGTMLGKAVGILDEG